VPLENVVAADADVRIRPRVGGHEVAAVTHLQKSIGSNPVSVRFLELKYIEMLLFVT
jgi:hypothetical protein